MNLAPVPSLQQAISMPGGGELLLILLIVLVVFGHNRLPAIGAGFGQAIRNFKKSMAQEDEGQDTKEAPPRAKPKSDRPQAQAQVEDETQDGGKNL